MFEGWDNVESFSRAEFPVFAVVGVGVDENQAAKGDNCSGVVI